MQQAEFANPSCKLTNILWGSAQEQLMPRQAPESLPSVRAGDMHTILLQEICIEIENARAFTANEIVKPQHVKSNPRSTQC